MQEEVVSLEEWRRRHERRTQGIKGNDPETDKLVNFVSDWVSLEKGLELIWKIGIYNNFSPTELDEFFENSGNVEYIAVGYASSPVLYLRMRDGAPEGYVHEEMMDLVASADDVDYEEGLPLRVIRAWWD